MRNAIACFSLFALLTCLLGCGAKTTVAGTVTLGGRAVERGAIELIPAAETTGAAARTVIDRGAFAFDADFHPGVYLVRISSPQTTGKKIKVEDGAPGAVDGFVDETIESVPAEFNTQSQLQRELKAGHNRIEFEL